MSKAISVAAARKLVERRAKPAELLEYGDGFAADELERRADDVLRKSRLAIAEGRAAQYGAGPVYRFTAEEREAYAVELESRPGWEPPRFLRNPRYRIWQSRP